MKKTNFLLIGPFPDPIDGCSLANQVLKENLEKNGYLVQTINTATKILSSKQGTTFSIKKVLNFLHIYTDIYRVFNAKVVYTTPGQTFFGVIKYLPFYFACYLLRVPFVIHLHGNYLGNEYKNLRGLKKKIFGGIIKRCAAGIVLSESMKSNFEGLISTDRIFVVNNFVQDFFYNASKVTKRTDKLRLLYLSNLMEEKGILIFLTLLKDIKRQGIDFYAEIAGKIEESIRGEIIEDLNHLGDSVKYLGIVSGEKKLQTLENSNVFILPTYYAMEGQPISILEALATGNIIISTFHAGIPDIISPDNGILVNLERLDELKKTTIEINENLQENVKKISHNNRVYAKKNFTEELFYTRIVKILDELSMSE